MSRGIGERVLRQARESLLAGPLPSVEELARRAGVSRASVYRLFGSRDALLRRLEVDPDPGARERVLAAAGELIGRDGLSSLSMEELAATARVSRANLYRLFPGKPALFRELVRAFSPMEAVGATIERLAAEPPEVVIPEVVRAAVRSMAGRVGMVRTLLFEVTRATADVDEAAEWAIVSGLAPLVGYLVRQMTAGRLRTVNPVLALQALIGPVVIHLITRPLAEQRLGLDVPLEDAAAGFGEGWLRSMRAHSD